MCTNRNLAQQLRINDVCEATGNSPEYATFRNITRVTASVRGSYQASAICRLSET
jgi:type VI secretion system protein ImpG